MNKPNHIKYLEGSLSKARKKNIAIDYAFFLILKSFNTSGYFRTKNHLSYIQKRIGHSKTTIRTRIESLIKNKLAYRKYNNHNQCIGIELISYDKAWFDILGYKKRDNNTGFKNYYEIYKISTEQFNNRNELIELAQCFDIWRNYQRRSYKEKQHDDRTSRIQKEKGFELSQLSMALILGYKSRMTGCRKQKQFKKRNLLQTFRRSIVVNREHILQYKTNYQNYDQQRMFFDHQQNGWGFVKQRLCNVLWINCNSLFLTHNNTNQDDNKTAKAIS